MAKSASTKAIVAGGDIGVNLESFGRHLAAENMSPRTQETYSESVRQFHAFLSDQGMPLEVSHIHRHSVAPKIAVPAPPISEGDGHRYYDHRSNRKNPAVGIKISEGAFKVSECGHPVIPPVGLLPVVF
ncbi:MAG: hypothetical protein ABGX63_08215 [bacterium]